MPSYRTGHDVSVCCDDCIDSDFLETKRHAVLQKVESDGFERIFVGFPPTGWNTISGNALKALMPHPGCATIAGMAPVWDG